MSELDYNAPKWLTVEYMETALRKYKKDNALKVIHLVLQPATSKGDNYIAVMTRIKADYTLGNLKDIQHGVYLLKSAVEGDPVLERLFESYDVYNTEMRMYEKVMPKLTALLHETGNYEKLFADTVHVDYAHSAIIFEDLSILKFESMDRLAGMDLTHAKLTLKKLAQMHGTAAVLNERSPELRLDKFDHGIFNCHTKGFAPYFEQMLDVCAEFAGDCPELGNYYKEKLLKLRSHIMDYGARAYVPHAGDFHTLTHGDCWITNVMVRNCKDSRTHARTPEDMVLIDFQFCAWTSPAVDLHYLFNTSLESSLRLHRQDELVQYYHSVLVGMLQQLKYGGHIPTLHEFFVQFESARLISITTTLVQQPVMINDKNDDADFNSLILDDERGRNFRRMVYTNKKVEENMKTLLPLFDHRGLLDVAH